jgi:hypothetical protein
MKVMIIKEACFDGIREVQGKLLLQTNFMNFKLGNFQKELKEKSHG